MADNIIPAHRKKAGVYIGRFQPLHNGHMNIIKKGIDECDVFIVIIGSIDKTDDKNPFSYKERADSIFGAILEWRLDGRKLILMGLEDSDTLAPLEGVAEADLWYYHLNNMIKNIKLSSVCDLYLYASIKDSYTKDYLHKIQHIANITEYVSVPIYTSQNENVNATDIRKKYREIQKLIKEQDREIQLIKDNYVKDLENIVPQSTIKLLQNSL